MIRRRWADRVVQPIMAMSAAGVLPIDQSMQALVSKADALLETLPYLQRFRGRIFVIKYGGSFMDSPDETLRRGVARDIVFLQVIGIKPVIVHGGGKAITAAMADAGLEARFVGGMRVTDEAAVKIVERVLSAEINPEIVKTINSLAAQAKGFSGADIFKSEKFFPAGPSGEELDAGFVGEIVGLDAERLQRCLHEGVIPVVSPTARGHDGKIYNCNADVAAARTATALKAQRLVFMSDVPGLLRDPKNPATLIRRLAIGEVEALKMSGIIDKGMIPKMDSAVSALKSGVEKVSLVDGRVAHSILLEMFGEAVGTEVLID
jgi:acetylglutamate kinase